MKDIMKILTSLEELGFLVEGASVTIKSETKKQKGGFLIELLSALGTYEAIC